MKLTHDEKQALLAVAASITCGTNIQVGIESRPKQYARDHGRLPSYVMEPPPLVALTVAGMTHGQLGSILRKLVEDNQRLEEENADMTRKFELMRATVESVK